MDLLSAIAGLLRSRLDDEVASGFPTLTRIPSTGIIKFLDYFTPLPAAERNPLLDATARLASMQFFPPPQIAAEHERLRSTNQADVKFWQGMQSPAFGYGLRYCDIKTARAMLNDQQSADMIAQARSNLDFQPRDDPPSNLVPQPDIRQVQPAKAPLLRKIVGRALTDLLGVKGARLPRGEVVYSGQLGNTALSVSVDFGSRLGQLRYGMKSEIRGRNLRAFGLTYEALWAANLGWDYLTEENAPRSVDLLCDLLRFLARLIEDIAAVPVDQA